MGNTHLITGYAGKEHITAADQGSLNAAIFGSGDFVFNHGSKFAASIISNNKIRVMDGDMMMQGRYIRIPEGKYDELTIENGTQAMYRNDLIVMRYTKDTITGIENVTLAVIKGTPDSELATDPEYILGDVYSGTAEQNDVPMYRVRLDGLNVQPLEQLFAEYEPLDAKIDNKVDKVAGKGLSTNDFTTAEKNKLKGIEAGATAYEHPKSGIAAGTYRSVTVDEQGHVTKGSNPATAISATLSASAWTDGAQAVDVEGITAGSIYTYDVDNSGATNDIIKAFCKANLTAAASENTITFTANGTTPSIDIPVTVVIL